MRWMRGRVRGSITCNCIAIQYTSSLRLLASMVALMVRPGIQPSTKMICSRASIRHAPAQQRAAPCSLHTAPGLSEGIPRSRLHRGGNTADQLLEHIAGAPFPSRDPARRSAMHPKHQRAARVKSRP